LKIPKKIAGKNGGNWEPNSAPGKKAMSHVHLLPPRPQDEEQAFLELANEVFQTNFPNPERKGCPDIGVLQAIAFHKFNARTKGVMIHVTRCSPCSEAFSRYCREYRAKQKARVSWFMKIAALFFVVPGLSFWFWIRHTRTTGNPPSPVAVLSQDTSSKTIWPDNQVAQNPPSASIPTEAVTLDLAGQLVLRGGDVTAKAGNASLLVLPRKQLALSLILPPGNEAGNYEVRLRTTASQVKATGSAHLEKQMTILEVQLNTADLPAGACQLGIRQPSWQWSDFSITLK
jgi:hypothetical protein